MIMIKSVCQSCNSEIDIGDRPEIGQIVRCPECEVTLEVVWLFLVALDFVVDGLLQPNLPTPLSKN